MALPERVVAGLSTSSSSMKATSPSSSMKARMASFDSSLSLLLSLPLLSSSSLSLLSKSSKDSFSAESFSLNLVCSRSVLSGFIWRSQCLAITLTLSCLVLFRCLSSREACLTSWMVWWNIWNNMIPHSSSLMGLPWSKEKNLLTILMWSRSSALRLSCWRSSRIWKC